jgi:hypothetical protein
MNRSNLDTRTPSPPLGYSRECGYPLEQQIRIVAEFYVHKIRPSRIAWRMGIDIDLVEKLIAGEAHVEVFREMVNYFRKNRRRQRLDAAAKVRAGSRYELQQEIEREFNENESL